MLVANLAIHQLPKLAHLHMRNNRFIVQQATCLLPSLTYIEEQRWQTQLAPLPVQKCS